MKKTVLILLAAGAWIYAGAQNSHTRKVSSAKPIKMSQTKHQNARKNDAPSFYSQAATDKYIERKKGGLSPEAYSGVHCGSAYNAYGVLDASTTAVTYDSTLGAILFTHREDDSKVAKGGSGAYEASVSLDGGMTWDTNRILFESVTCRYPNGVIYNPMGNTIFDSSYWVAMGPVTTPNTGDEWTSWDSVAYGSMKFDSSHVTQAYTVNGVPGVAVQEGFNYMESTNSAVYAVGDGYYTGSSGDNYYGSDVCTGTLNTSTRNFTWAHHVIQPDFVPAEGGTVFDSVPELMGSSGTAWSQDGTVGYVVFFGNLDSTDAKSGVNLNFMTYQPIVYKTTNSGATWSMMTPHNFRNDSALSMWLPPTLDSGVVYPLPRLYPNPGSQGGEDDYDMVVDKNDNLHIFLGLTASAIASTDSSNYYAPIAFNSITNSTGTFSNVIVDYIFDLYTTSATGGWKARFVDSLQSQPSQYVLQGGNGWNTSSSTAVVAFGHRIQATRTIDGSKIFCTWVDDVTSGNDSLVYPDLFGQGYDVTTGNSTPVKQFTNTYDQYYICVSDKPIVSGSVGSRNYTIPVVRIEPPAASNDATLPVYFLYDDSAMYTDNDFQPQSVAQISSPQFSITQNYPNPFNGLTRFNINLVKESTVSIDVINMVGQKMITISPVKMDPGTHAITINGSGFAAGVYFYRVNVDGTSLTQKMVIE
ncbi:MAG: T9SS type A sorting domain-containing protein [Bacteroidia bacterium]